MLPVAWTWEARDDLRDILDYIAARSPASADRMQALFLASAESLRHYPLACREGRRHGTRELVVHPNYILVYRVEATRIRIVSVVHTSRQYP